MAVASVKNESMNVDGQRASVLREKKMEGGMEDGSDDPEFDEGFLTANQSRSPRDHSSASSAIQRGTVKAVDSQTREPDQLPVSTSRGLVIRQT